MTIFSNPDCLFENKIFDTQRLSTFSSEQLASIVGQQHPNGYIEDLSKGVFSFLYIPTQDLKFATEYNEEPQGGWAKLYEKFLKEDEIASKYSPEYLGRDEWIRNHWLICTATYPLFIIKENNVYRVLDGTHRLSGAFYYELPQVASILVTI
jgi:hypothetical protein